MDIKNMKIEKTIVLSKQSIALMKTIDNFREKKDLRRLYLSKIFYDFENKRIVATNGKALISFDSNFITELDDFNKTGFDCFIEYKAGLLIIYEKITERSIYPNYKRVIPESSRLKNGNLFFDFSSKKSMYLEMVNICLYTETPLNIEYLEKMKGYSYKISVLNEMDRQTRPVVITEGNNKFFVILMPFEKSFEKTIMNEIPESALKEA